MRKIFLFLAVELFSCLLLPHITLANDTGSVVVCVESIQNIDNNAAQKSVLKVVGQTAVKKALGRFITPDSESTSIFQAIISESDKYIIAPVKVLKIEKIKGRKLLFCEVKIDFTSLETGLRQKIQFKQESVAHQDDEVFFFIRVIGINDLSQKQAEENKVMNFYADAFQTLGFHKSTADEIVLNITERYKSMEFQDYLEHVLEDVSNNVAISIAVIGEIRLLTSDTDVRGTNSSSLCNIMIVKNSADGQLDTIGTFSDKYTIRRSSKVEAEKLVLQKAAYNSAKYLSHLILENWKQGS